MSNTVAAPVITVKGRTTETVLRDLAANPTVDPAPIITELVARYDAKAARREAKAADTDGEAEG